jgi:sterol desaturase/sphingolipid hydroxylase (fatty acid hydroxylase superfamily)
MLWLSLEIGKNLWPEEVENKGQFIFNGEIMIHTAALVLSFLIYLPGYMGWAPSYEKFKINKDAKWPWQRNDWNHVFKKMVLNIILNEVVVYPMVVYIATSMTIKQRFIDFPSFWELLSQLLVIYFVEDFFFYWGHRMFHETPLLYRFHKVHHEYDKVFTVATEYFHPVDLILGNVVSHPLFRFPQRWP